MSGAVELNDVAVTYDRYAAIYDRVFGWVLQDGRNKLAAALHARAQNDPTATLVELGVGTGLMLHLYPQSYTVIGVDVSAGMLAVARKRVEALQINNVTLELVDAEHSHLPEGGADHVVLPYVYSVSPNPDALIDEAWRLCKLGGTVWILNHFSGTSGGWAALEALVRPFAKSIGFRSEFSYDRYVTDKPWTVARAQRCNLLGLSRLIEIRKDRPALK
jgi:phosphatidylethanolamine/phosphatidyl-N-methylethanolamine N-methyltransferase